MAAVRTQIDSQVSTMPKAERQKFNILLSKMKGLHQKDISIDELERRANDLIQSVKDANRS